MLVELEDWGVEEDEEDDEEEEEEVKFIPDNSGGFVAVFCPLKLFLHTGHVSCWEKKKKKSGKNIKFHCSTIVWQTVNMSV